MQFAIVEGVKVPAVSGRAGSCPVCNSAVIPKCGSINVHHWAHASCVDCDPWWEPESGWHRWWKEGVPPERVEVPIKRHRADIVTSDGIVVELQHSSISTQEIAEREAAYERMVWVFDGAGLAPDRLQLRPRSPMKCTFRWKHPRKHYAACRKRVFIDLGDGRLFRLDKLYLDDPPYGGWGKLTTCAAMKTWLRT